MLHFSSCVLVVLVASGITHAAGQDVLLMSTQDFLAQHPQIAVGREALDKARENFDDALTFTAVDKPAVNVIVVQAFAAGADPEDFNAALYTVALIGDDKAEKDYSELSGQHKSLMSPEERVAPQVCKRQPIDDLFKRASGCNQFCGTVRDCTRDRRCPSCYYVRGNCRWQKWCRPRAGL